MSWGGLRVLLLAFVYPSAAASQPASQSAIAEALFLEGKTLFDEGEIAPACRKLEESVRLERLGGSVLNLAFCHEAEGRIATAWSGFRDALSLARADKRKDREVIADEHLRLLEPQLPKVVVKLAPLGDRPSPPGLTLFINGEPLGAVAFETELPLDPGVAEVRVEAEGFEPFTAREELVAGKVTSVIVSLVEKAAPVPAPIVPVQPPPPPSEPPHVPDVVTPPPDSTWETIGWATLASGGALAILGASLGGFAITEDDAADQLCGPTTCATEEGRAHSERAVAAAMAASVLVPVGATFAVAGLVVGIVAHVDRAQPQTATVRLGGAF
jgi:hypothetical protein